ncbi:MAG TPA: DNA mismatch repair endonuclease MutL [Candidatus Acidoferrales bacterium]|nr:DNA mismatch repair endonuclease MutL [Candidatus Acidoferrales bacterium]
MSRIRILPENVANKIAAGEVVERPASVVKELLENALDAGARSIRIEVESGGKRLIRVTDDGSGMNHDDALLAFERHATSKLRTADDLLSIATLGFRGEALPSIAAISRLVLETRAAEPESAVAAGGESGSSAAPGSGEGEQGTRVEFAGGKLIGVKPAGVPAGTSLSVGDIFYCMPARRKFLKSETTELGHIASLATHYALAHPEVRFQLKTPSQVILDCAPVERLEERVYQVFGRQALEELVEIPPNEGPVRWAITEPPIEGDEAAATLRVSGFTSRPEVQRVNRNGIYIFVNRRLVRDRLLLHAIGEAYRNIMPPGVFPTVLLFLDLPYQEVDVNVHPAKIEVRFRHPQFIHDFTRDALRHALSLARPIPGFPAARAAAAAIPMDGANASASAQSPAQAFSTAGAGAGAGSGAIAGAAAPQFSGMPAGPPRAVIPDSIGTEQASSAGVGIGEMFELSGAPDRALPQRLDFGATGGTNFPFPMRGADSAEAFAAADASAVPVSESGTLPGPAEIADLKPLGQVNSSFIVAVNAEGLWIIDQHVAHERVLFEQHLRARREGELGGQRLLVPLIVELNPRQLATFEQIGEELRANGFEAELMGGRSVAIKAAPAGIASGDAERLLQEILDGIARENQAISIDTLQSKIAASTACHAAIKVNTPLDSTKMTWLLEELAKTEYPMSCPHGRPVVLRYSVKEIERAFKRI